MVKFVEVLSSRCNIVFTTTANNPGHSTTRLANIAQLIRLERWKEDFGIPTKYFKSLQRLPEPPTRPPRIAALLLSEQYRNAHIYHSWGGLFPFCYGQTVKEMAEAIQDLERMTLEDAGDGDD
ncbi:MAG: hypothetical protein M1816_005110 [Peltula sp. TS41687]|nr:MAG: hypothetical protein M1816_005110 [Peltula sp. TS41687]